MEKAKRVFISHSSKDVLFTNELKQKLEENGFDAWLAEHDLLIGEPFPFSIVSQIKNCDYFCIVLTVDAMQSNWVYNELIYAFKHYIEEINSERVFIIPILLSPCKLWDEISIFHYIDFTRNRNYNTLIDTLKVPKNNYLFSRQKEFKPPTKKFDELLAQPKDYIERNLSKNESEVFEDFFDNQNSKIETLSQIILKHNYICVLSEAGIGKSTELANLAYILSNDKTLYQPFYYKLNSYKGQPIIDFIPKLKTSLSWYSILILDGYDEIDNHYKKDFLLELNNFTGHYPFVIIVISSRTNLKPPLEEFNYYYVQELSNTQITEYCNK